MAAKKAAVKPVEKAEAPKAEIIKAENKAAAPAAPVKAETKKETVKKAASVKKAPAKRAVKKAEMTTALHVQFSGKSYAQEDLVKMAKDIWKYDLKQKAADLVSVDLYVKPEENTVYYVMNKEFTGSFFI